MHKTRYGLSDINKFYNVYVLQNLSLITLSFIINKKFKRDIDKSCVSSNV